MDSLFEHALTNEPPSSCCNNYEKILPFFPTKNKRNIFLTIMYKILYNAHNGYYNRIPPTNEGKSLSSCPLFL
jgi:hypothetical protein